MFESLELVDIGIPISTAMLLEREGVSGAKVRNPMLGANPLTDRLDLSGKIEDTGLVKTVFTSVHLKQRISWIC